MAKKSVKNKDAKYEIRKLIDNSIKLFGEQKFVAVGAFCGQSKPITIDKAKELVKKFKERKVK